LYQECKNDSLASPVIAEKMAKILTRASKNLDGGYAMAGLLGMEIHLCLEIQQGYVPLILSG
jgi:hypothetical protein